MRQDQHAGTEPRDDRRRPWATPTITGLPRLTELTLATGPDVASPTPTTLF